MSPKRTSEQRGLRPDPGTPVPAVRRDAETEEFFAGTERGELLIRRCDDCGHDNPPPASACARCHSAALTWTPARGTGSVVSWSVVHGPARDGGPPARTTVAIVELDEGPWLHSRLAEVDPADVHAGLRVAVTFDRPTDGEAVPVFRPT
ncbi:Zn-ribbon domain-containing OB-fold protein [Frankia sp. Cr2]|uniref:Zn-ribbon domain-containing OB-fold protein n=1 Tax=Frankia sp. Cr2 TaxID=3073932 RepID=UPI002AD46A52|nr:OB-fold domain-containing protein [Frankia sp. Cr2]